MLSKEELIKLFTSENITVGKLPNIAGQLPDKKLTFKMSTYNKLVKKIGKLNDSILKNFVITSVAKGTETKNNVNYRFYWLQYESWDELYNFYTQFTK